MPQFPQELVNAFIECLIIDRSHALQMPPLVFTTLLSCALVSQSFSAPARKHLFSSISLDLYKPIGKSQGNKVPRSPEDVSRRIKVLGELLANEESDLRPLITSFCLEVDEAQTIFDDSSGVHTVLRLLSTACNLKSFKLTSTIQPELSWTNLRMEVRELLTTFCCSPSIKSLSVSHFSDVPVDLVLGNPRIASLWLVQTTFSKSPGFITSESSPVEVTPPTTIKRLNISFYLAEFWEHFSSIDRIFSDIENFGTSIYSQTEVGIFKTVLDRMPRSLKSLDLIFWGHTFEDLIRSLDMRILRCLRTITFCLVLGSQYPGRGSEYHCSSAIIPHTRRNTHIPSPQRLRRRTRKS
ncbi:hypothetical protein GALMADRAFT_591596 [Galerina marginata CBS 339.88]|uniref:F-box domain-containing protein n=1 Tax=Galerina marginata (strain CBS 339.88) TaxID=685588 RepID=A0A067SUH8_GALM3|nr:hypothetical protein GALMADRAFT_591596 [Galerina marginata CBS 339.88]